MTREENISLLKISVGFFIDLFIYNLSNVDMLNNIIENKEKLVNELTNSLLYNKCLISQLKRELDNIEFDLTEVRRAEDEKM